MDTPLLGFSHLQLRVRDVDASREWYTTVLGVETMTEADDGSYVALRHRPSHVVIVISSRVDGAARGHARRAARPRRVRGARRRHAAPVGRSPHRGGHRASRASQLELGKPTLQLRDPDGINVELVAPAPRTSSHDELSAVSTAYVY